MKKYRNYILSLIALFAVSGACAQGLHFSQYYNAPMLLNPANTALMSETDYRLGLNYRNQWGSIPVPFSTTSAYADFQLLKNRNLTNWLGVGAAMFADKAGDGQLSLTKYEGFVAYHIQTGNYSMFSAGMSFGYAQRSIDFSKLSFDRQWDGFKFDTNLPNGEQYKNAQTSYMDVGAGVNYAYYPNEYTYIKLGVGVAHVNMPKESFYDFNNKIDIRPTVNLDALFVTSETFTLNPSVYYTRQGTAQELMYGLQVTAWLNEDNRGNPTNLIIGAYHRLNDAVVPLVGFEWAGLSFTSTYDFTLSSLSSDVNLRGGLEFALIYRGLYHGNRDKMNCPRF